MKDFDFLTDQALSRPLHLTRPASWVGHIPAAMWLVELIRPEQLVELGTHTGNSYFAFCQAVKAQALNCRCFAVDTWQGDDQAGHYGDDIHAAVQQHNRQHYDEFSTLLRMTFDAALPSFAEGSVDLLHIDGLHTYAAVSHDFNTWCSKLSERAVVLFHDTMVERPEYGVRQFWREVSQDYSHFHFDHSNGLGVLLVGPQQPRQIQDLVALWRTDRGRQRINDCFQRLGEEYTLRLENSELVQSTRDYAALLEQSQRHLAELISVVENQKNQLSDRMNEIAALSSHCHDLKQQIEALTRERNQLVADNNALLQSTSWRVTAPLRGAVRSSRQFRQAAVTGMKQLYYRLPLPPAARARVRSCYYRFYRPRKSSSAEEESPSRHYLRQAGQSAEQRLLVIERSILKPDQDAGSLMIHNFLRVLRSRGCAVDFIPLDLAYDESYTPALEQLGIACFQRPLINSVVEHLQFRGGDYDYILVCRPDHTEELLPLLRSYSPQARLLYETHDLHFLREQRQAEIEGDDKLLAHSRWRKAQEMRIVTAVDCTLVVSEQEREIIAREVPGARVEIIPVIDEVRGTHSGFERRADLIFIGGFEHRPNVDAVLYFVRDIFPLVRRQLGDCRIHVVGSHPPEEVTALATDAVIIHGFVPELEPLLEQVRISVNPLRFGAGVKGKIITSMAAGVPCVGTSIALEGLPLAAGDQAQALVADTPEDFAAQVVRLYSDAELWRQLSAVGITLVRDHFSLGVAEAAFERIFTALPVDSQRRVLPLIKAESRADYQAQMVESLLQQRRQLEESLIGDREPFQTAGYCFVCDQAVDFSTTFAFAATPEEGPRIPNWREHLSCPGCRLNNRMRAAIHLFHLLCAPRPDGNYYLTEQVTPLFNWFAAHYPGTRGSEFLAPEQRPGTVNKDGIRHEDLTRLSFADQQLDAILSFDVFEHIPDYRQALKECQRCLKPDGSLFFTVPFTFESDRHLVRARINAAGEVEHLLPPEYHGNPLSEEGCLCFYHFGWELLDELRTLGFRQAAAYLYWSREFAYLGGQQLVFRALK